MKFIGGEAKGIRVRFHDSESELNARCGVIKEALYGKRYEVLLDGETFSVVITSHENLEIVPKFEVGDKVVKAKAYSAERYCKYSGEEKTCPIGTVGTVTNTYSDEKAVCFKFKICRDQAICLNVDESELMLKSEWDALKKSDDPVKAAGTQFTDKKGHTWKSGDRILITYTVGSPTVVGKDGYVWHDGERLVIQYSNKDKMYCDKGFIKYHAGLDSWFLLSNIALLSGYVMSDNDITKFSWMLDDGDITKGCIIKKAGIKITFRPEELEEKEVSGIPTGTFSYTPQFMRQVEKACTDSVKLIDMLTPYHFDCRTFTTCGVLPEYVSILRSLDSNKKMIPVKVSHEKEIEVFNTRTKFIKVDQKI